jgi:hypothetical protein
MNAFPALGFISGVCPVAASSPRRASSDFPRAAEPFLLSLASAVSLPLREYSGIRARPVARAFEAARIGDAHGLFDVFVADFHGIQKMENKA